MSKKSLRRYMQRPSSVERWDAMLGSELQTQQLEDENEVLRMRVQELTEWKIKATNTMAAYAPKREKVKKAQADAKRKLRQVETLEADMESRIALQTKIVHLEKARAELHRKTLSVEDARAKAELELRNESYEHGMTKKRLATLEKVFVLHLESLAAHRLHAEARAEAAANANNGSSSSSSSSSSSLDSSERGKLSTSMGMGMGIHMSASAHGYSEDLRPAPAQVGQVVAGWIDEGERAQGHSRNAALAVVAQECVQWIEDRWQTMEAKGREIQVLLEQEHEILLTSRKKSTESLDEVERLNKALELERSLNEALEKTNRQNKQRAEQCEEAMHLMEDESEKRLVAMETVVDELRDYVNLVQIEVKKKFGYVPFALVRPDIWSKAAISIHNTSANSLSPQKSPLRKSPHKSPHKSPSKDRSPIRKKASPKF